MDVKVWPPWYGPRARPEKGSDREGGRRSCGESDHEQRNRCRFLRPFPSSPPSGRTPRSRSIARDMIALRIGPDLRMVVVGCPAYLADDGIPVEPQDLTRHRCCTATIFHHDRTVAVLFSSGSAGVSFSLARA